MFTFFKIGELPHGRFVFKDIEGKDWHAEVQSRKPDRNAVRSEFYQKRAALKMKANPDTVLDDIKKGKNTGYKTMDDFRGIHQKYNVPSMPSGMNEEQTKEYFDKNPNLNTLFKILKDYFDKAGVSDKKQVEREVLLSLHYLRQQDVNVDHLNGGETVVIEAGFISINKADGTRRLSPRMLRPKVEASAVPAPKVEPPKPPDEPEPKPKPADPSDVPPSPRGGAKSGPPTEIPLDVQ